MSLFSLSLFFILNILVLSKLTSLPSILIELFAAISLAFFRSIKDSLLKLLISLLIFISPLIDVKLEFWDFSLFEFISIFSAPKKVESSLFIFNALIIKFLKACKKLFVLVKFCELSNFFSLLI